MDKDGKFGETKEVALTTVSKATAEENTVLDEDSPDETAADGKLQYMRSRK